MSGYRLQQVDDLSRPDHHYLTASDNIFYLREYTSGQGFRGGETNSRILNLKKQMDLRGTNQWKYKTQAIAACAAELRTVIGNPQDFTWVPVPPSKSKSDPLYDDRLVQVVQQAFPGADIRDLVEQTTSTAASHTTGGSKPTPRTLRRGYQLNTSLGVPKNSVVIFDDILTTGSHFKAVQEFLQAAFQAEIVGLFLARRVFPDDE